MKSSDHKKRVHSRISGCIFSLSLTFMHQLVHSQPFTLCIMQAFTRCAQQEPDNGEAWNNIAAIHLQLQHAPEAFSALSEAVKYKRDSWQTWANYGQAAAQTGNNLPAARAVQKASFLPIDLSDCAFRLALQLFWGQVQESQLAKVGSSIGKQLPRLGNDLPYTGCLKGRLAHTVSLVTYCSRTTA